MELIVIARYNPLPLMDHKTIFLSPFSCSRCELIEIDTLERSEVIFISSQNLFSLLNSRENVTVTCCVYVERSRCFVMVKCC